MLSHSRPPRAASSEAKSRTRKSRNQEQETDDTNNDHPSKFPGILPTQISQDWCETHLSRPRRSCPPGANERRLRKSQRPARQRAAGSMGRVQLIKRSAPGCSIAASTTAPSQMQFGQLPSSPPGSGNFDPGASSPCEQHEHACGVHPASIAISASHERQLNGHINKLTISSTTRRRFFTYAY